MPHKKIRLNSARSAIKQKVVTFLGREDNARTNPGKRDCVKTEKSKVQTKTLLDYMHNLHVKFSAENPNIKISLSTFCKLRPQNILLTSYLSKSNCLCQKHQNCALKLKALRKVLDGTVHVTYNPDTMISQYPDDESKTALLERIDSDVVTYDEWRRVKDGDGKLRTKIVQSTIPKNDFVALFEKVITEFREHVHRIKVQNGELKKLKEDLPENHVIIQMDFAENYNCSTSENVQSSYWCQTGVTLHPCVIYYTVSGEDGVMLDHKSIVYVSDMLSHNTSMVYTIIDELLPEIKTLIPDVQCIHYYTDSPFSQYRNKAIFHLIATHQERYGITATWDYFECGHGKGPCDGVGGTIKRSADQAVKQGTNIQYATDFYVWASNLKTSSISYCFVSQDKFHDTDKLVKDLMQELKPIKGTATLHAIRPPVTSLRNEIAIEWRSTSSHNSNDGWQYASLMKPLLVNNRQIPWKQKKLRLTQFRLINL